MTTGKDHGTETTKKDRIAGCMSSQERKRAAARILDQAQRDGVQFVRLWFTDILGRLKGFTITVRELETALTEGMGFDGSSIEGFVRIEESDLIALPDPDTYRLFPWSVAGEERSAVLICDIKKPDGSPYEGDPRFVLRKALSRARDMGFTFYVGPELEYFYFRGETDPTGLDHEGYFDFNHHDIGTEMRKETVMALESMGIEVEYSHHEVAPSQHEIDLRYREALQMADITMIYRVLVREVARRHGYHATFMPKPVFGVNGSGMHVHQSLFVGDKNAFFDADDEYHLSKTAKRYLSGLLHHVGEIIAVTNQWVNSYKRLVPDYEAPVYVSWGQRNRSALVRVPMYKPGKEKATRIEFRAPDPAANPYLAFAAMLSAGLEGLSHEYPLPKPVEDDIFRMNPAQRRRRSIRSLPRDLNEAVHAMSRSKMMRQALGDHVFETFIANKKMEWDRYMAHVSRYEIEEYLPIL